MSKRPRRKFTYTCSCGESFPFIQAFKAHYAVLDGTHWLKDRTLRLGDYRPDTDPQSWASDFLRDYPS